MRIKLALISSFALLLVHDVGFGPDRSRSIPPACRSMSRRSAPTRSRAARPRPPARPRPSPISSDQFAKAGLQPGGDLVNGKRSWTQAVPLLRSEFAAAPHVSVDIAGKPTPLTQGEQIAVRAPTNGDKAMTIDKAPLVFVGYGVKAPERGWDDFKGLDAKGKILVMLVNDPDFEGGEGDFGGKAMTYYGRWTYKYEEGARQGAAGVLVDPRDRARQLWLGDGQELEHQRHVRHRPQESARPSIRRSKAGSSATSPRSCSPPRAPASRR